MNTDPEAPLAPRTTLNIGGVGRLIEIEETADLDRCFEEEGGRDRVHVLGRGSNVLFPDHPLERPVVHLAGAFRDWSFGEDVVRAGAGVYLPRLSVTAARQGWSGLEWAAGVPGSVGGAVAMNAGAFGREVAECLRWVRYWDDDGDIRRRSVDELEFDYRFCELRGRALVLEAAFELDPSDAETVIHRTRELMQTRREEQPVGETSAGCVFQNPNGTSAGALIDRAGLKGASEGAIQVSRTHANYFINRGGGTATDLLKLVDRVQNQIHRRFDVDLELELQVLERP